MELQVVNSSRSNMIEEITPTQNKSPFIESNTKEINLSHLKRDCTIPVFAKDNEITISHQDFIEGVHQSARGVFSHQEFSIPSIRVSHIIKGRTPEAIRKPANELLPHEKTIYYERMAFTIDIPTIQESISGNTLSLSVGGVRAYNQENLYSKKSLEKFKVFVGFKNWVCTNLCISTDGFSGEIRASNMDELQNKVFKLLSSYSMEMHLEQMSTLEEQFLTETQFAQLLGKARLYNHLPKKLKNNLPDLIFNDGQLNKVARDYYEDESFCKDEEGNINLWNVYNLFTGANKSSYIDSFLERNVNAHNFTNSISEALKGNSSYHWFLS
ncbi:DUF3871 family protein [Winogradskyella luteola]|uniref:DUF3871 family protein n=1 Tax=Winogradskyella luteola TaxID=2828330 RepID=A0A9X1F9B3_9FLAO|nr:DUF3871 family protein [Winogradskyella luteola]MBV7268948.1 DUF3871 family protein [Winogradskyella luteola]